MKKFIVLLVVIFLLIVFFITFKFLWGWQIRDGTEDTPEWQIRNLRIWKDTPVWDLALAVKNQDVKKISKINKSHPGLLNYQEPRYGTTLLIWSIGVEKYNSAKELLKCGADPNIVATTTGETALFLATGYSWVDNAAKKDPKYVKLLLSYGANPNINYSGSTPILEKGTSPLINSIGYGIDKTKALLDGGAEIDYKTSSGMTAAIKALEIGGPNATINAMRYAYYLIVEKKANVKNPYYILGLRDEYGNPDPNNVRYPVDILRNWIPELNSEEHKLKMDIVEEIAKQGIDYWKTEIPQKRLEQIKKIYQDTWQEYVKKY
ncbi:ankyrin repeat domain-containing protein [Paenibacillus pinihumi]|uniref:ankyrin repeat domain-containing protein n=1 Tax=Paenibacillus pinihumi TaxID=669462 RepID=UPI000408705C|nr:ankyrin repeat domain-containing protein [Paenibacillus pinihumi]